jgi:hypothetical protein
MATLEQIQAFLGFHAAAGGHIGRPIRSMKPRTSAAGGRASQPRRTSTSSVLSSTFIRSTRQ